MRRKHFFMWFGLLVLVVGAILGALALLLYHEPAFYQRVAMGPSQNRKTMSAQLLLRLGQFIEFFSDKHFSTKKEREEGWSFSFKEEEINSYFEDGFRMWGDAAMLAKRGISEPRIAIEPGRIRLAFRYGTPPWSTLISMDFRLWVVPREVNVVALEILNRRAGAMPISAQFFLDQVTEIARKSNIDVTWYRNNGNPVALLRFQSDRIRPSAQLRRLEMRSGMIVLGGNPVETAPIAVRRPVQPSFQKIRTLTTPLQTGPVARATARLSTPVLVHTSIYPPELVREER